MASRGGVGMLNPPPPPRVMGNVQNVTKAFVEEDSSSMQEKPGL